MYITCHASTLEYHLDGDAPLDVNMSLPASSPLMPAASSNLSKELRRGRNQARSSSSSASPAPRTKKKSKKQQKKTKQAGKAS